MLFNMGFFSLPGYRIGVTVGWPAEQAVSGAAGCGSSVETVRRWLAGFKVVREVAAGGAAVHIIPILRVVCPSCHVTHAVLPDFIRPYGRYVQHVRQTVVPCLAAGVPVEKTVAHGQVVRRPTVAGS